MITLHPFPERIQPSGLLKSQLAKLTENPLRCLLGLPEAAEPTAALLEIQAYDERCLPGEPAQWAEPGKPFVGALTLESPTDTDDDVLSWIAGPHDMSEFDHLDQVKLVSAVNHAAILPACRVIVHHGGAGTTAAAMRAGAPAADPLALARSARLGGRRPTT